MGGEAVEKLIPLTARLVGTPYTHTEKGVAREGYVLICTIEGDAAWRMSWGVEHTEGVTAEAGGIAVREQGAYWGTGWHATQIKTHHPALCVNVLNPGHVGGVSLWSQTVGRKDETCTKHMIEMAVGAELPYRLQLVVADIGFDGPELAVVEGTAVDDDAFVGLVAHYVAVFLKGINGKSLDVKHLLQFSFFNQRGT